MMTFAFRSAAIAAAAVTLGASAAQATTVHDGKGLLPTFDPKGAHTTDNFADLDVKSATVSYDANFIYLSATMFGNIGATKEGFYVWGIDTGTGQDFFQTLPHPEVGVGVKFDTFIVLNNDDTGGVNYLDPARGHDAVERITHDGSTINAVIRRDILADDATVDISKYGFNIWPRTNAFTNVDITDFAPDDHNFNGSASVPEPATWALMIAGFGVVGSALRRRRSSPLAA
jgi:hypothetical protein